MNTWKYDEQSMTYKKIKKLSRVIRNCIVYFISSIVLAAIYYVIFALLFDNEQEKQLKTEYENLASSYDSLNTNLAKTKIVLDNIKHLDTLIYRSVFKTNPIEFDETSEMKNANLMSIMENYDMVNMNSMFIAQLKTRVWRNKAKIERMFSKINADKEKFKNIPAIQPIENKDLKYNSASVGVKIHPFYRIAKIHTGIDYTVPTGTRVFATANGVVEDIIVDDASKGNAIFIDHGNGYKTVYAHLDKILVAKGAVVKRGKTIALSGDTGLSIFPHLHYEVWKNGKFINPINCFFGELSPTQLRKMKNMSSNIGQSLD
jgi:hypothetical protein